MSDGDHFDFVSQATREPSTPSVSEIVVTKVNDIASEPLFRSDTDAGGFIIDGSADPFVDPSNPNVELSSGLVDETNIAMGDGSVRFYNPYITVDYVEV